MLSLMYRTWLQTQQAVLTLKQDATDGYGPSRDLQLLRLLGIQLLEVVCERKGFNLLPLHLSVDKKHSIKP